MKVAELLKEPNSFNTINNCNGSLHDITATCFQPICELSKTSDNNYRNNCYFNITCPKIQYHGYRIIMTGKTFKAGAQRIIALPRVTIKFSNPVIGQRDDTVVLINMAIIATGFSLVFSKKDGSYH